MLPEIPWQAPDPAEVEELARWCRLLLHRIGEESAWRRGGVMTPFWNEAYRAQIRCDSLLGRQLRPSSGGGNSAELAGNVYFRCLAYLRSIGWAVKTATDGPAVAPVSPPVAPPGQGFPAVQRAITPVEKNKHEARRTPRMPPKKRDEGKSAQCVGIYIAHLQRGDVPPTPTELARAVGCNPGTAWRAIRNVEATRKELARTDARDRYQDRA